MTGFLAAHGTAVFAPAAFFTLQARAAQNHNGQVGLLRDLRCHLLQ
jgi:hypothetical protein